MVRYDRNCLFWQTFGWTPLRNIQYMQFELSPTVLFKVFIAYELFIIVLLHLLQTWYCPISYQEGQHISMLS